MSITKEQIELVFEYLTHKDCPGDFFIDEDAIPVITEWILHNESFKKES